MTGQSIKEEVFFHNLDHFQEPHGVWEGHVSMWGASQRN